MRVRYTGPELDYLTRGKVYEVQRQADGGLVYVHADDYDPASGDLNGRADAIWRSEYEPLEDEPQSSK